jgi:hypothetical protein
MMSSIGLAVKAITIHKNWERKLEPYWAVYAGTDANVQDSKSIQAISHVLRRVPKGERLEFPGLGYLILPPVEIKGTLLAWHVELWESDEKHRTVGEAMTKATKIGRKKAVKAAKKLAKGSTAVAAVAAVSTVAKITGEILKANGDDLLMTWAGSLYSSQLETFVGTTIYKQTAAATVRFRIIGE